MLICHIWYTSVIMFIWTVRKVQKWKKVQASYLSFHRCSFSHDLNPWSWRIPLEDPQPQERGRPRGAAAPQLCLGRSRWDEMGCDFWGWSVDPNKVKLQVAWDHAKTWWNHGGASPNTKSRTRCGNDSIWSSERIGLRDSGPGSLTLHSQPQSDDDNHSCLCFPSEEHGQFQSVIPPTIGPLA